MSDPTLNHSELEPEQLKILKLLYARGEAVGLDDIIRQTTVSKGQTLYHCSVLMGKSLIDAAKVPSYSPAIGNTRGYKISPTGRKVIAPQ